MGENTTKVAVVGFGYWGKNLVRNFSELGALAAVCDNSDRNLELCRTQYPLPRYFKSYDDLLKDDGFQAVVIASPAEFHTDMVRKAFAAGKDVFVEKPLSLDVESGRSLVDLAENEKRILMVGHLLWYHPAVLKLKELVDGGELGRIHYIYSNRLNLGKVRLEENVLWSFAPHDISVILGLLGEMPNKVQADGGVYLNPPIADVTVSTLSFPSGAKAHVFVSWLNTFKEQRLVVIGERKMAVFNDLEKEHKLWLQPYTVGAQGPASIQKPDSQPVPVEFKEPLRLECEHFLNCVRTRERPRTDGREALRVLEVLAKCQEVMDMNTGAKPSRRERERNYVAHESAFIDAGTEIGDGTTIWHVSHILKGSKIGKNCRIGQNVVIGPNATVGNDVKIQNNVSVYEGVTLEDRVFCGPSMVFTNVFNPRSEIPRMNELQTTLVKKGATLGANCTIVCGVTIGEYAFVGAGAVVTKDIPPYGLVVGVPGRLTGWMCRCGTRLEFKGDQATCGACQASYTKSKNEVTPK